MPAPALAEPGKVGRAPARAVRLLAAALAALLGLAGCGIPAQRQPHPVAPPPYQTTTSAAPSPTPAAGNQKAVLYLTRNGNLVQVTRTVDDWPSFQTLLDYLAAPLTPQEQQDGLSSALAGTDVVDGVRIEAGLVTVMLANPGLDVITPLTQGLAIAQIVCTLDAREDVTGVVFERAGVRVSVPRGDGSQTDAQLTAADYAGLLEPPR